MQTNGMQTITTRNADKLNADKRNADSGNAEYMIIALKMNCLHSAENKLNADKLNADNQTMFSIPTVVSCDLVLYHTKSIQIILT